MGDQRTAVEIVTIHSAFLLLGGKSSRLGQDKRFLSHDGKALFMFQVEKLVTVFSRVRLLCKQGEEDLFHEAGVECVGERETEPALIHGLIEGLSVVEEQAAFFLGVDLPFVNGEALRFFQKFHHEGQAVVPGTGGKLHFCCAVYPVSFLPVLERCRDRGEKSLTRIFADYPHRRLSKADLPFLFSNPDIFFNINTSEDLAAMRSISGVDQSRPR